MWLVTMPEPRERLANKPLPNENTPRREIPDVFCCWRHITTRPFEQPDFTPKFDGAGHKTTPQPVSAVVAVDRGQSHGGLYRRQFSKFPLLEFLDKGWVLWRALRFGNLDLVLKEPHRLGKKLVHDVFGVPVVGAVL